MLITIQSLKERRIAIYREARGRGGEGRTLIDGRVLRPCSLLLLPAFPFMVQHFA
jgi:hypothetical protein